MTNKIDFCKYFEDIENDPAAITPQITVRQFYECKKHLEECDTCSDRADRIVAKMPASHSLQQEKN